MHSHEYNVVKVKTEAFTDQRGDFNGLRKSVQRFQCKNYVENYLYSYLHVLSKNYKSGDLTLITGYDGRYYGFECIQKLLKICAANTRIKSLLISQNGVITTPAASCFIKRHTISGGILFTAGSLPGGPEGDFGIKIEDNNGAPLEQELLDRIYMKSRKISEYYSCPDLKCDINNLGEHKFKIRNNDHVRSFYVRIVDTVEDYVNAMKDVFDFKILRNFIKSGARIVVNAMNGAAGPFIRRILWQELGLPDFEIVKFEPLDDFGGLYPEPIPVHIEEMFALMHKGVHEIGFALGGDGQHCIVLGKDGFYVNPSDSLAIVAANIQSIAYYKTNDVKGFARTLTTSRAIDRVAKEIGRKVYELPLNWFHSSHLIEMNAVSLAGDEGFCMGAEHCRERDGIWVLLAFLNILEVRRTIVNRLVRYHWSRYGKNVFLRYEFDKIDISACKLLMDSLERKVLDPSFVGKVFNLNAPNRNRLRNAETLEILTDSSERDKIKKERSESAGDITDVKPLTQKFEVIEAEVFKYEDPVDGSHTREGIKVGFSEQSRIIFKTALLENGNNALRIYIEKVVFDQNIFSEDAQVVLKSLYELAINMCQLKAFTSNINPIITH